MKKVIAGLLLLCLLPTLIGFIGDVVEDARAEQNVYHISRMPAFEAPETYSGLYPPLVRLEDANGHFFCSGTVISNHYVLTAAHCLMEHRYILSGMTTKKITIKSMPNEVGSSGSVEAHAAALNQRADYALITGDFSLFAKAIVVTSPLAGTGTAVGPVSLCGFPWGSSDTCYIAMQAGTADSMFIVTAPLYPGMSGGPVLAVIPTQMSGVATVVAVNSGTLGQTSYIAPLIGLFETLGVEVK